MSKSTKRMSVLATAFTAALITLPLAAPSAVADPPRWAPAHGYRHMHGHGGYKYKYKQRRHKRQYGHHHVRRHVVRRTVYVSPPYHDHYRHGHGYYRGGSAGISPSVGGTIVGAVIGGLGGSTIGSGSGRTAAIIGGVAAGAVIGNSIGRSMEDIDRAQVQHTLENGRTGSPVIWQNPDTGNRYEVTPTQTYQTTDNRYCREYISRATVGGREDQVYGTACRMPDGSWQLQPG